MASSEPHPVEDEGRQIRLVPLAAGTWWILLGAGATTLGPLFGFLVGTIVGVDGAILGVVPIFFFLFLGFMVAGLGLGVMLLGVRRLMQDDRDAAKRE